MCIHIDMLNNTSRKLLHHFLDGREIEKDMHIYIHVSDNKSNIKPSELII